MNKEAIERTRARCRARHKAGFGARFAYDRPPIYKPVMTGPAKLIIAHEKYAPNILYPNLLWVPLPIGFPKAPYALVNLLLLALIILFTVEWS